MGPFALVVALLPSVKVPTPPILDQQLHPCPRCAELVQKAANFCRYCGAKLEPPSVVRDLRCFACNHLNPHEAIRCEKCGGLVNILALFK